MVISDKQALRRCVKQAVRRAEVVESMLDFDILHGVLGVKPLLSMAVQPFEGTPLGENAVAASAAMDALEMPFGDPARAELIQSGYTRDAYLREILDVMKAKRVLVRVPMDKTQDIHYHDDRLAPLVAVSPDLFVPGRYGTDYRQCAESILESTGACDAQDILDEEFDQYALEYSVIPACQDGRLRLHIGVKNENQLNILAELLDRATGVYAVVFADYEIERRLIDAAAARTRMIVRLSDMNHLSYALDKLGLRFIPYASCAELPELMLGRWICAREKIWQSLCEAYLPLARSGYSLQSEDIVRDVQFFMSGNLKFEQDKTAQYAPA